MHVAKAIASEGETVRAVAQAVVSNVKSAFSLEWFVGVSVRHRHLDQRCTIQHFSSHEVGLVDHQAFAVVEAHAHGPTLPCDLVPTECEAGAIRLRDLQLFDAFPPHRL
eukprot:scaffold684_cov345-Pavlova_lutheri.AAC.83